MTRRAVAVALGLVAFTGTLWTPRGILMPPLAILDPGSSVAQAAPRKSRPPASSARKPKKARSRKAPASVPAPVLPDDPATPLRTSWERHLAEFFRRTGTTCGAFVALDPRSGALLALAEHSRHPCQVRHAATEPRFPAASVFKVVTAAALLESAGLTPRVETCYHGGRSSLAMHHLKDSPSRDRACRSLASAFALSTNAVFGKLALKYLDSDRLLEFARRLGFNRRIEVAGQETTSRARKARDSLDLGRMAAGFTNAWLSPLHGALLAAVVANGGMWPPGVRLDGDPARDAGRALSPRTASHLRAMMELAATGGTGRKYLASVAARGGRGNVAVKTGTLTSRDGTGLFNTWMVGFYPANAPEVAFAALISTQGGGPIKAGHLTRYALETYLRLKKAREGRSCWARSPFRRTVPGRNRGRSTSRSCTSDPTGFRPGTTGTSGIRRDSATSWPRGACRMDTPPLRWSPSRIRLFGRTSRAPSSLAPEPRGSYPISR